MDNQPRILFGLNFTLAINGMLNVHLKIVGPKILILEGFVIQYDSSSKQNI